MIIRESLVRILAQSFGKSGSLSRDLRDVASNTYRYGTGALLCALLSAASKILSYFMLAFGMDLSSGEIVLLSRQRLKILVRQALASASTVT